MSIVKAPDLLMPKEGTDMRKWAVVACDQFTSQPEYWDKLDKLVGQEPSTLRIVFPEAYLSKDNAPVIERINKTMREYLDNGVLCDVGQCMVLVERRTEYAERRGLGGIQLQERGQGVDTRDRGHRRRAHTSESKNQGKRSRRAASHNAFNRRQRAAYNRKPLRKPRKLPQAV